MPHFQNFTQSMNFELLQYFHSYLSKLSLCRYLYGAHVNVKQV